MSCAGLPDTQGVSFVIPVRNGERHLEQVLQAIYDQSDGRPMEVLVVEDGSIDRSEEILRRHAGAGRLVLIQGERRGAAAAANLGIRQARHPLVCQVDQDVVLQPGWMDKLLAALQDPQVAAAQGYYVTDAGASVWARVMGLDLEHRYSLISGLHVDHVCTGNTAYRASALGQVGLFDESFGYGYDNDMSYRLGEAGFNLVFCRQARSIHHWRQELWPYLRQQYGVGYGRLDLVGKHRGRRVRGDDVSGLRMILHVPVMLAALLTLALAAILALTSGAWQVPLGAGGLLGAGLAADRLVAGLQAWSRVPGAGPVCLAFVPAHLLRDLAWVAALLVWTGRRLAHRPRRPRDSMPGS